MIDLSENIVHFYNDTEIEQVVILILICVSYWVLFESHLSPILNIILVSSLVSWPMVLVFPQ